MLHPVKFSGFNHMDHSLNLHVDGEPLFSLPQAKKLRENRKNIQAYLFLIQARINRGQMKGAIALFNRLLQVIDAPLWVAHALKDELTPTTPLRLVRD